MADYTQDQLDTLIKDSLDRLRNEDSIKSSLKSQSDILTEQLNTLEKIKEYRLSNIKLTESGKKEFIESYDLLRNQLLIEKSLSDVRRGGVESVKRELLVRQQQLKVQIQQRELDLQGVTYEKEKSGLEEDLINDKNELAKIQERYNKLEKDSEIRANKILNLSRIYRDHWSNITSERQKQAAIAKEELDALKLAQDAGAAISDDQIDQARKKAQSEANKAELANQLEGVMNNIASAISGALKSLNAKVESAIDEYGNNFGKINARLQTIYDDNAKDYAEILNNTTLLSESRFLNYKEYMSTIEKFSAQGISYNIEERAFLESVSDKIVASFNALDASLLRMTRLQQADMTRYMLGNEATLTRLFNEFFEDSSYLAQNVSDGISSSIVEAASTMNQAAAVAFEFTIQKWLGSLYEVGVSQETINSLASAINALGSGNAQAFMDSPVATLLNMSIARSDYSLADVLTQGLNTEFIDNMMSSMITLLSDIKDNTSNQVTLQAYSNVLGMSVADMRGIVNLKDDIKSISEYQQTMETADEQVKTQLSLIGGRTSVKEQIDNTIDNLMYRAGVNIASNGTAYAAYLIGDLVEELAGGTLVGLAGSLDKVGTIVWGALQGLNKNAMGVGVVDGKTIDAEDYESSAQSSITVAFSNLKNQLLGTSDPNQLLYGLLGVPEVRNQRGHDFIGVTPDYTQYYNTVTQNVSSSQSVSSTNSVGESIGSAVTSSEATYYDAVTNAVVEGNTKTEQDINNLINLQETEDIMVGNAISQESADALEKEVSQQQFYNELFREHNFPIWIDFAPDTLAFLTRWYETITNLEVDINDRQYDTHVTNVVDVQGEVTVVGGMMDVRMM